MEEDGAVFAAGDFTKNDIYQLRFANVPGGTRSIRLQVLPDERLPAKGPGIVAYEGPEGDFFLSKVKVRPLRFQQDETRRYVLSPARR